MAFLPESFPQFAVITGSYPRPFTLTPGGGSSTIHPHSSEKSSTIHPHNQVVKNK